MNLNKISFQLVMTAVLLSRVQAQNTENSPLSRYGLGDLRSGTPVWISGMGQAGTAFSSPNLFSGQNPASAAYLLQTDVEIGLVARQHTQEDSRGEQYGEWTGGIQNILVGIPLQNAINDLLERRSRKHYSSLYFGLNPFSGMGYNAVVDNDNDTTNIIRRNLQGDGGITAFKFGLAHRYKGLAFGAGADFLFGTLTHNQSLLYLSQAGSHDSYLTDQQHIKGLRPVFGLQYQRTLNQKQVRSDENARKNILGAGLQLHVPTNYTASYSAIHLTRYDEFSVGNVSDTILNVSEQKTSGGFPLSIRAGLNYLHQEKSGWVADVQYDAWASRSLPQGLSGAYADALGFSFGGWYRSGRHPYDPFLKKSTFRAGIYYQEDYRLIRDEQAFRYGLSLGWSYPISFLRQDAMIHLSLDAGKSKLGDLFSENYFQIHFGVSINDNEWFLKRRYN